MAHRAKGTRRNYVKIIAPWDPSPPGATGKIVTIRRDGKDRPRWTSALQGNPAGHDLPERKMAGIGRDSPNLICVPSFRISYLRYHTLTATDHP
jgi:hypothetical protein